MTLANNFFTISSFFYIVLVTIVYFSKKRIRSYDNFVYKIILLSCLATVIFALGSYITITYREVVPILTQIVTRGLLVCYLIWDVFFANYIFHINEGERSREEVMKGSKYYRVFSIAYLIIGTILVCVLPLYYYSKNGIVYSYGKAANVLYMTGYILFVIIGINLIKNRNNLKNKKYYSLYIFMLLSFLASVVQKQNPGLLLATGVNTYVTILMFFTIANPDVKLIASLELSKNQAERANRAKSDFLSSMSHEIRTPLNAIVGLSNDILEYQYQVPKEVIEDSNDIVEASNTLLEIVGNILDISKIESGKLEIIPVEYNFKEELSTLAKINKVRIGAKPIEFKLTIAEDIPYELIGDKIHVKEILNNLISNAIKYTEKGLVSVNAQCINRGDNCTLIITVQDSGRGIKKEDMAKLFSKFDRLEVEKSSTVEGTGLGLAITKNLVELMDGKINVQSNFGQGSIFMVQIPQKISKMEEPLTNKQMNTVGEVLSTKTEKFDEKIFEHKKVLLVDDNALNIKVALKALQTFNFEIDTAKDGEEAIRMSKEKTYDLILMDIMMPIMSGESALEELKKDPNFKVPVIALTADAVQGSCEKYLEEGFTDYIAKPFSKDQIKEKLVKIFKK